MALFNKVYKDLNITFARHPIKGNLSVLEDEEAVARAVKNLVLTNSFERFYNPLIGANILKSLFEPMDTVTEHTIKKSIQTAIDNHEPRVIVHDIIVNAKENNNAVDITVRFRVDNKPNPSETTISVERIR
jgi:phage baseplate assembly protein W